MSEQIPTGKEMASKYQNPEKVIRTIMENALRTRPEKEVYFQPFQPCSGVGFTNVLGSIRVDLDKLYPYAKAGEAVVADFNITCTKDEEIYLNILGNANVWYNQKHIHDGTLCGDSWVNLPILVKKDEVNPVRILCVKKDNGEFGFEFLISVKRYPKMWANDYLFAARATLPIANRANEEGIALSGLLTEKEYGVHNLCELDIEYAWPTCLSQEESFDFKQLCGAGNIAYVYTEAKQTHELHYQGPVEAIWINGVLSKDKSGVIAVQEGDRILLRCFRSGSEWKLSLDTEHLYLPFVRSCRGIGDKALFVGPFYGRQSHGPEFAWDFSKVFTNDKGARVYWRFCDGSELRAYLDSVFFGQWFYALMVGFYGIRDAAIHLEDRERQQLFYRNMHMLAQYFDYVQCDIQKHTMPAFMPRVAEMNVLDNIGTMGMNLIDAYLDSNDSKMLPLIERIQYQAEKTIPRLEDGTYFRVDTMWADDLYMSCPFLVRMGVLTGNVEWYRKAAKQIQGFKKRLYIDGENLFSHIWFPAENRANCVPWGRGNGWVMWTLSELLMFGQEHLDLSDERKLFYDMAHGIWKLQSESGLWRQVLNRTDEASYLETSCTAMFLLAFTRGVRYGWLEKDFFGCIEKAWYGILNHSVDQEGNVYGVCMGSGCAHDPEYYYTIPTAVNDDHGTGVILAAAAEYWALKKEWGESCDE